MKFSFLKPRRIWYVLRSGYWFVPLAITGAAVILCFATLALDERLAFQELNPGSWLAVNGAEAAGTMSMIANSMITVTGVVLSITVVTLTLASGQYGPRVLRMFTTDHGTQVVVGLFAGTFLFALLVLRLVHQGQSVAEVPQLSVATANLLAVISLGALIYFIHHVSVLIQANYVAAIVATDLEHSIERAFPEPEDDFVPSKQGASGVKHLRPEASFMTLEADQTGYIDTIDYKELFKLASQHDLVIKVLRRPGDLIYAGDPLARIWPNDGMDNLLASRMHRFFAIVNRRTPQQDIECGINELTEVAVRSLSPSINDPTTAIACIDRLGAALSILVSRRLPSNVCYDEQDLLRLITRPFSVRSAIDAAFDEIRQYASQSTSVHVRLLETIGRIGRRVRREADARTLLRHSRMILRSGMKLPEPFDRNDIELQFNHSRRILLRAIKICQQREEVRLR